MLKMTCYSSLLPAKTHFLIISGKGHFVFVLSQSDLILLLAFHEKEGNLLLKTFLQHIHSIGGSEGNARDSDTELIRYLLSYFWI